MARLGILIVPLLVATAGMGQQQQDEQFQKAGVCARCHVISVVEWGMSKHSKVETTCMACHGTSQGHVIDERNNVKPERVPHEAAIAGLCATCHADGCPKEKTKANCQTCHHVHALVNPNKPPSVRDEGFEQRSAQYQRFTQQMAQGEQAMKAQQWQKAKAAFEAALKDDPGDRRATEMLRAAGNRLEGALPGFEIAAAGYDSRTGLPREVKVAGAGIAMVLVPGGDFDMGAERFAAAKPVHTVTVEPFYLAKFELTQGEWKALMGSNPSVAPQADNLPVDQVSWEEAEALVKKLNEKVPGGGFRLPTEAEWEFAARTGSAGNGPLSEVAWFDQTGPKAAPHPVGTKKPDKLGLYDMFGNVWEWTSSLAMPYPFDPGDGREATDGAGLRILRGGGYGDTADLLDPGMRHSERPTRKIRWNGVRLARSVPR